MLRFNAQGRTETHKGIWGRYVKRQIIRQNKCKIMELNGNKTDKTSLKIIN